MTQMRRERSSSRRKSVFFRYRGIVKTHHWRLSCMESLSSVETCIGRLAICEFFLRRATSTFNYALLKRYRRRGMAMMREFYGFRRIILYFHENFNLGCNLFKLIQGMRYKMY